MKPALLIIDMQNDFVLPGGPFVIPGAYANIPRIRNVLEHFRREHLPVLHIIREYLADGSNVEITRKDAFLAGPKYGVPGTKGAEIVEALAPAEGEHIIVKSRFSAFFKTGLEQMLQNLGVDHVVICGIQYPNCIRATAFDAISCDFPTTVITDATSAATEEVAQANIHDMRNIGIQCVSFEEWKSEF